MAAAEPVPLLAVLGSVTPPGRLRRAVSEALGRAPHEVAPAFADLADLRLEFVGRAREGMDEAAERDAEAILASVESAEAVLFATPVYRGSMTGALKNLFDALPVAALAGKPVGLVAMGASDHHFLGAERHVRDVLAFFGALQAPVSVYLTSADFQRGEPSEDAAAALDQLLHSLAALALARRRGATLGPAPLAATAAP